MTSLSQLQEVPPRNLILVVGPPGAGKTTFCQETALKSIGVGPVIYVTTEATSNEVVAAFQERGLVAEPPHPLGIVDAFRETVGLPRGDQADALDVSCGDLTGLGLAIAKMRARVGEDALLVFDSLTSPYLLNGTEVIRFLQTTLLRFAVEGNAVLTCIDEGCGRAEDLVAMMSLADGIIKIEVADTTRHVHLVKHPTLPPTRLEASRTPPMGLQPFTFDPAVARAFIDATRREDGAWLRGEVGDFVHLFWPNLAHWSGMLWDPHRFPQMIYEVNRQEPLRMIRDHWSVFPRRMRFFAKVFLPKDLSSVRAMKRMSQFFGAGKEPFERSWIVEYLADRSKTEEHYFRVHESYECAGFADVGASIASHFGPENVGTLMGFEAADREWNAIETQCVGRGAPACEFKFVPGPIDGLETALAKDSAVIERVHDRLMQRLLGFLTAGTPLAERPRLGPLIHIHPVFHAMGFPHVAGERYQMALRLGGAKTGREVGARLLDAGVREAAAVERLLHFLNHCRVGKVTVADTIQITENCESLRESLFTTKQEAPCCYFTTGFLNGFFTAVTNQHVRETQCIAMGAPYCEWEFR